MINKSLITYCFEYNNINCYKLKKKNNVFISLPKKLKIFIF